MKATPDRWSYFQRSYFQLQVALSNTVLAALTNGEITAGQAKVLQTSILLAKPGRSVKTPAKRREPVLKPLEDDPALSDALRVSRALLATRRYLDRRLPQLDHHPDTPAGHLQGYGSRAILDA